MRPKGHSAKWDKCRIMMETIHHRSLLRGRGGGGGSPGNHSLLNHSLLRITENGSEHTSWLSSRTVPAGTQPQKLKNTAINHDTAVIRS